MLNTLKITSMVVLVSLFWSCGNTPEEAASINQSPSAISVNQANEPLKKFETLIAQPGDQSSEVNIIGRVQALQSIQIVAEVQGQAKAVKKLLNEGIRYQKGETLVRIDDTQYRLNLQAQKSQFQSALVKIMSQIQLDYPAAHSVWDQYLKDFDETKTLSPLPTVKDEQLHYFLSANNVFSSYYQIKSAEEILPKYQINAPFTGVITQGSLSPGAIVSPGQPIASYSRTDVYEVKVPVSSADIALVKPGQKITLKHSNTGQKWTGTIHRIGASIDPGSQSIPIFIRLSGKSLKEGMFMEANLAAGNFSDVVALPLVALNRNNQVHIIKDSIITLKDVIPVHYQGEKVWVKNLQKGDQVIIEAINQPVVGIKAQSY